MTNRFQVLKKQIGFTLLEMLIVMGIMSIAMVFVVQMMSFQTNTQQNTRLKVQRDLLFMELSALINNPAVLIATSGMLNNSPFYYCIGNLVSGCPPDHPGENQKLELLSPQQKVTICSAGSLFAGNLCSTTHPKLCQRWIRPNASSNPLLTSELISCVLESGNCQYGSTNLPVVQLPSMQCSNTQKQPFVLYDPSFHQRTKDSKGKGGYYDLSGSPCTRDKPDTHCDLVATTSFSPIPSSGPPFTGVQITLTVSGTQKHPTLHALTANPILSVPLVPTPSRTQVFPNGMIAAFDGPCPSPWKSLPSSPSHFLVGQSVTLGDYYNQPLGTDAQPTAPNPPVVSSGGSCSFNRDKHWATKSLKNRDTKIGWDVLGTDASLTCNDCKLDPQTGSYNPPYRVVNWCYRP